MSSNVAATATVTAETTESALEQPTMTMGEKKQGFYQPPPQSTLATEISSNSMMVQSSPYTCLMGDIYESCPNSTDSDALPPVVKTVPNSSETTFTLP